MDKRRYKTEGDLPSELTCPICFQLPPKEVFQCKNGHTICKKCSDKLPKEKDKAPTCPSRCEDLEGVGLIRAIHIEEILDQLRLDCSFRSNGCPEIHGRSDFQKHQDSCCYDPDKFGTSVKCCRLLFDPDCHFGVTLGNGKVAKEHFVNEHNCIVKKLHKFEIEVDQLIQQNNTASFCTPILAELELEEKQCLILISPLYNSKQNSVGFLPIFIPTDENKTEQCSVQLELSQSLRRKFNFTQIPISFNNLEAILPNLEQLPKRRTSSNGGEKVGFHFQPKSERRLPERNSVRVQMFSCGRKTRKQINHPEKKSMANKLSTPAWLSRFQILMAVTIACLGYAIFHCVVNTEKDDERKNEFIMEFDLFPVEEKTGIYLTNERERQAVDQVLNVLSIRNQEHGFDQLKLLFENGIVKVADISEETQSKLLYLACRHSNENVVRFFIEMEIPVNSISSEGLTPLHYAVENNRIAALEICKVLIENRADCNMRSINKLKLTPLEWAKKLKGKEFAGLLNNFYFKHRPTCYHSGKMLDKFYFESTVNAKQALKPISSEEKDKLFREAAMEGTWGGVKYLLENVAEEEVDVNSLQFKLSSATLAYIHVIFLLDFNKTRGLEKIKFLVEEKGADIYVKDHAGRGYLFHASRSGSAEGLEYFLSKGLEVKAEDTRERPLLSGSIENEDELEGLRIGKILLYKGASCFYPGKVFDAEERQKLTQKLNLLYEFSKYKCVIK